MAATDSTPGALWLTMSSLVLDHKNFWRELIDRELGLPFSRFRALRRIEREALTQRDLAERLRVDASAMTSIVNDLVGHGLATRVANPADGRSKLVDITDEGRAFMDRMRGLPDAAPPLLDTLNATERRELARLLAKMRSADVR